MVEEPSEQRNVPSSNIGRRRAAAKDEGTAAYAERREEIKVAAGDLFKKNGFRGTSIGSVAQTLGIDRATLYYYIGSKEELFDEIVTNAVRENNEVAEEILQSNKSAPEKIYTLVTSLVDSYARNYPFLYVFIQENLSHVGGSRAAWSQGMRRLNKRYEQIVTTMIQSGIDDGTIRPVADAWVMAYGLIGMAAWTNRWFHPERSSVDADSLGRSYASMLLAGMSVDPGSWTVP